MLRVAKFDEFQLLECLWKRKKQTNKQTDQIHFNELYNLFKEKKYKYKL